MDSDSDRTIDSDELDAIIAEAKRERLNIESNSPKKGSVARQKVKLHDLSDSGSEHNEGDRSAVKKDSKKCTDSRRKVQLRDLSDSEEECNQNQVKYERSDVKKDSKKKSTALRRKANLPELSDSEEDCAKRPKTFLPKKNKSEEKHNDNSDTRPKCRYGSKCYRKNPDHFRDFSHICGEEASGSSQTNKSNKSNLVENIRAETDQGYGFYVTKVHGIPEKFNYGLALGIKDILSSKKGKLIASAQFNYMFDIPWLMQQYPEEFRKCPLTIVHGEQRDSKKRLEKSGADYPNIKFCQAKLDIPYGTHHTKMMFLLYEEGFRVVIHTSNIVDSDWFQKTQGIWVSPLLPKLQNGSSVTEGESPTKFKSDLLEYISSYGAPGLEEWCMTIKKFDFSKIRVVLIGSVPGRHIGSKKTAFGHLKLRKVLNLAGPTKEAVGNQWPIIGQFSSIGSLGATPDLWLCGEWVASLATCKGSTMNIQSSLLKLVFPSVENVRKSLEGYPAGASLPYSMNVAQKQSYLKNYLHQWKSEKLGRSEASPHIKTYLRVSPDYANIAWFLVTSANLSKAAWGALEKKGAQFMIRSYELGVLFLPENFGMSTFSSPNSNSRNSRTIFPVPYDIPLESYSKQDQPWIWDIPHIHAPDRNGNKWCPQ